MMDIISKLFGAGNHTESTPDYDRNPRDVLIATCAILIEMANIDGEFSPEEREIIISTLKNDYHLSEEHAKEITRISQEKLDQSLDLWKFTNLINQNYNSEEKIRIIELVWRIIYSDGTLDRHEDYLIHKLAGLLNLTHSQLIDAKIAVLKELKK